MIATLHIKNIGIIEDICIDLNKGLNVLTGETGAGKTLIIDSLQIISGGRFSKEMIRKGETNSFVELCLYEPENENSIEGNIIVSREIQNNGKNMCKINIYQDIHKQLMGILLYHEKSILMVEIYVKLTEEW